MTSRKKGNSDDTEQVRDTSSAPPSLKSHEGDTELTGRTATASLRRSDLRPQPAKTTQTEQCGYEGCGHQLRAIETTVAAASYRGRGWSRRQTVERTRTTWIGLEKQQEYHQAVTTTPTTSRLKHYRQHQGIYKTLSTTTREKWIGKYPSVKQ